MTDGAPALALDISGSRTFVGLVDPGGTVLDTREVANHARDARVYWPAVLDAAAALQAEAGALCGVGVAFGGPVDRDGQVISMHVAGWAGIDPAADLRGRLGLPVRIDNDANAGALGEYHFGTWGQVQTLIFMTCSTGIGAGVVSDGQVFRGTRGLAGEVGHTCLDPHGIECCCGSRGCLEALCSGTAMARRGTEALAASDRPSLLRDSLVDGRLPGARPLFEAAAAGDELAAEVLSAICDDFGRGLANIQHSYDPDLIVVGGGVSLAGRALTEPVTAAAQRWLMSSRRGHLRFEAASRGLHSQLLGAACLALGRA